MQGFRVPSLAHDKAKGTRQPGKGTRNFGLEKTGNRNTDGAVCDASEGSDSEPSLTLTLGQTGTWSRGIRVPTILLGRADHLVGRADHAEDPGLDCD